MNRLAIVKHINVIFSLMLILMAAGVANKAYAQYPADTIHINIKQEFQVMENFGASDAWAGQFVGNWPNDKRNAIADWLFSSDTFPNGDPKGIGLTMWRYNFGAGSASQGSNSGIKDEWRRAASLSATGEEADKIKAQNWLLMAAKQRGVKQFLGFFNSPPVELTKNGKAFASNGICNIDSTKLNAFADYAVHAIADLKQKTGITLDYLAAVNEPQWDWSDGGQEGSPYTNNEIYNTIKAFDKAFNAHGVNTKLLITESGHIKYLLPKSDKPAKDDQVNAFFHPASPLYVGNLKSVSKTMAAHSYFSTSPYKDAVAIRAKVKERIAATKGLRYWQSEYCVLGDNSGEINGSGRDTGINAALYVAKVINEDLCSANATAWQWWLSVSPYNYKDGLIYIDKNKTGGNVYASKLMWAMGNYSRFIRPGMVRVEAHTAADDIYVAAFKDKVSGRQCLVAVNTADADKTMVLAGTSNFTGNSTKLISYTTNNQKNLAKLLITGGTVTLSAKSIVTFIAY